MLVIREEQMRLLSEVYVDRYVRELAAELRAEMPERLASEDVEGLIRYGLERAATYGVKTEAAVARYVRFQIYLGRDFDCDPAHFWARPVLSDPTFPNDAEKMTKLTRLALDRQSVGN